MTALPSNIDIAKARLPATYEQAKVALASCANIDECQDWANKAEALASYAKMADDDSLRTMADRIQARAVRRMGELLKQFRPAPGTRIDLEPRVVGQPRSITEYAMDAKISGHQRKQAMRVASVPEERFEAAIEQPKPATVTKLAEMGKHIRSVPDADFKRATHLIGAVTRFAEFCRDNSPVSVAAGMFPDEAAAVSGDIAVIDEWLSLFVGRLDAKRGAA